MAWRNIVEPVISNLPQNIVEDPVNFMTEIIGASSYNIASIFSRYFSSFNGVRDFFDGKVCGDDTNYITGTLYTSSIEVLMYINDTLVSNWGQSGSIFGNNQVCGYVALVNDDTEQGYFELMSYNTNNHNFTAPSGYPAFSYDTSLKHYLVLTGRLKTLAGGGGATHIARRGGHLDTLSIYLSDLLIVAGGGGGGLVYDGSTSDGADAGGMQGNKTNSANQTTGFSFGAGQAVGGGSGLYGGFKIVSASMTSGGGGSGYIGNSLLTDKQMVGHKVTESSIEDTKTISVNTYSENGDINQPKAGNGKARITFSRPYVPPPELYPRVGSRDEIYEITDTTGGTTGMSGMEIFNAVNGIMNVSGWILLQDGEGYIALPAGFTVSGPTLGIYTLYLKSGDKYIVGTRASIGDNAVYTTNGSADISIKPFGNSYTYNHNGNTYYVVDYPIGRSLQPVVFSMISGYDWIIVTE